MKHKSTVKKSHGRHGRLRTRAKARDYIGDMHVFRLGGLHVLKHLSSDDPKVYTKPFTVNLTESLEADTDLIDEFCLEGEKDYERPQRLRGK